MARITVPAADALLDIPHPVLDHGFVRLVDYLGSDDRIVQAARVSYGAGTKSLREDASLIDYLMRHAHTSPFEQVVLTFHVKLPVFVARQWVRHRTARINEISARYSVLADAFYLPPLEAIRPQSRQNKQGRDDKPFSESDAQQVHDRLQASYRAAYSQYEWSLTQGVARELARLHLPVAVYTEMYWQIDLHNLFHFLELRLDHHAQAEIREYAKAIAACAKAVAPEAYAAFSRHRLETIRLSKTDAMLLIDLMSSSNAGPEIESVRLRLLQRM